jgi:hypothetical protein
VRPGRAPSERAAAGSKTPSASRRWPTAKASAAPAAIARLQQVARRDAEQVAEQQLAEPRRDGRREGEQRAEAEQRADDDRDRGVAAQALVAARQRDRGRRQHHPAGRPEQQRQAGQRGQHQAREHPVRNRLGGVALAVEDDPDAERPAGERQQQDLGQRPLHQRRGERVGEPAQHGCSWSWCSTAIARRLSPRTISSAP